MNLKASDASNILKEEIIIAAQIMPRMTSKIAPVKEEEKYVFVLTFSKICGILYLFDVIF